MTDEYHGYRPEPCEDTEILVELVRDGVMHRLHWRRDGQGDVVEEQGRDGAWHPSGSQAVTAERFPLRLFSQGQIAALAGESRQALLDVIDEASGNGDLHHSFDEAKHTWLRQRAQLRELDGRLAQERQQLEADLKQLDRIREDREKLKGENQAQWGRVVDARKAITRDRQEFVKTTLTKNHFVRMDVVAFGFEPHNMERGLRALLDCQDTRFESDILQTNNGGEAIGGLAFELAQAEEREAVLNEVKQRLTDPDEKFGGRFSNYLQRKLERPEFADHIQCWFPDDDLRIQYSRMGDGRDWQAITQGSQGQRAAALLAFLLAFGDEPLILDQPEDDLDNHLIYDLIVRQIRENKRRRQLIIVTHNPNVVVNGDAEMVYAFDLHRGQCRVMEKGALQEPALQEEVCQVMEGGREAFPRRWKRLGRRV